MANFRKKCFFVVIDFHTHTFPQKLAPHAVGALEKTSGLTAKLDGTLPSLQEEMRRSGVCASVLLPIAVKPEQTKTINTCAIENNALPHFFSFGSVHPKYPQWREELVRIKRAGLLGIKLHPDYQGMFVDDPEMIRVMAAAAEMGLYITIHGGYDVSYLDLHRSTPKRVLNVLPHLPKGAVLICAHMGGYGYLHDVEQLLCHTNVYIDTSFTFGRFPQEQLLRILRAFCPDHILFGTDSPWDLQTEQIAVIRSLPISQELKEKILFRNACRLLHLA